MKLSVAAALFLASGIYVGAQDKAAFIDHGPAAPISHPRGIVSTVDGNGRNVVLILPMDGRGAYELLQIDAETGKTTEVPLPFKSGGDSPYSSILSKQNKYYGHLGYHFFEFDPSTTKFSFFKKCSLFTAMSMHEDDNGVIWSATYPEGGLASYNPRTREFIDHGAVNKEKWAQYPRSVTSADDGWIYSGIGNTNGQISAYNPATKESRSLLSMEERPNPSSAVVARGVDGKAYGRINNVFYGLLDGKAQKIEKWPDKMASPGITSSQNLFHQNFPNGDKVLRLNMSEGVMTVSIKGEERTLNFKYSSDGCRITGVAAVGDGNLYGGTAFPMRFFKLDTKTNTLSNKSANGYQFNTMLGNKDNYYVGAYYGGHILRYRPAEEWTGFPKKVDLTSNPAYYGKFSKVSLRPHALAITEDGKTLIMGGTPEYGCTGGGIVLADTESGKTHTYPHTVLAQDEAPKSFALLPGSKTLVIGTTVSPGTGGEQKAKESSILGFDLETHKKLWAVKPFPKGLHISALVVLPDNTLLGVMNSRFLFKFDLNSRKVLVQKELPSSVTAVGGQGCRPLFMHNGQPVLLTNVSLAKIDPDTCEILASGKLPFGATGGGDFIGERFYYFKGTHVHSVATDAPGFFVK